MMNDHWDNLPTPDAEFPSVKLYCADAIELMPQLPRGLFATSIVDPPYGVTSLKWDKAVKGWWRLLPTDSFWCFGSLAFFLSHRFPEWTYSQEIVWEKHNGANFHADRFRRVHELAAMFYRGAWANIYHETPTTNDARAKTIRRKQKPSQCGPIEGHTFTSIDGGPRMMRSVIRVRSCHGEAIHPTQKPLGILDPLIEYSCPPGGTVLDPFGGSFSTAVACARSGRRCVSIERDRQHFDRAVKRVDRELAQGGLFIGGSAT